jgi:PAS domain S-box-containing protein
MAGFEAKQLQSIFQSATDAIIIADEHGIILSWNAAAERIFEWTTSEIIGKSLSIIMPSKYSHLHEEGMHRFNSTGEKKVIGKTVELEGLTKNGKVFPIELSLGHWNENGKNYFSGIIRDITVRKGMEAHIEKAKQELELKVVERTNELIQRNAELEQYVYVVSHDLKEPMRSVTGLVALLKMTKTDSEKEKYFQLIQHSADRMMKLVDDLLEHSRLGADRNVSSIDFASLLNEVQIDLQKIIQDSNAEITYTKLPTLYGLRTELRLLFQNLISNAIKFRKPNSNPKVEILAVRQENQWQFLVKDNGIGIASEYLEKVFVIFKRLHNRDEYEGSGIGLTHCKKIVELHGGKIWVESTPEQGSAFFFTLPDKIPF